MLPLLLLFLTACSTLDLQNSRRAAYDSYVAEHLEEQRLFIRLRETAKARFLEVTPQLSELQAKLVPGFELAPTSEQSFFVVAIEMPEWARFSISDFRFFWGDYRSTSVKEISDPHLIQTVYSYAVPHDRVFLVEFVRPESRPADFKMQTPQGQFIFKVGP